MLKDLLNSKHIYSIFKTIYEQEWSYFTLTQLIKPHKLDKGNTTRYLKKLCDTGLITKLENSAIYVIDRENLTIQSLFTLIKIESLNLTYSADQHIFLKYEKYFRNQKLHHSRVEWTPFFLSIVCEAEQKDEPRKRWCHHTFMPYIMQEGHIDRYLSYNDLHRVTAILFDAAQQGNTTYLRDRLQHREQDRHAFDALADMLDASDLTNRTLKETTKQLTQYISMYIQAMSRSSILEACRFDVLPHAITHIYDTLLKQYWVDAIPSKEDIRSILTAPLFPTYIDETYTQLRTIALEIKDSYPLLYDTLLKEYDPQLLYEQIETTAPFLAQMITDFRTHHYQGISFAGVRSYTLEDMFTTFSQRFIDHTDIHAQILTAQTQKNDQKTAFDAFLKQYTFDDVSTVLIGFLQDIQRLKDISTRYVLTLNYHGNRLLKHLAKLKNSSLQTLLCMSYDEVLLFCHNLTTPKQDILEQRVNYSLCIQKDHRYHFYLGEEAERLHGILLKDTAREFTGMRWSVLTPWIVVGSARTTHEHSDNTPCDIVVTHSRKNIEKHALNWIKALLLEEKTICRALLQYVQSHPEIPVIIHVDGLSDRIQPGDILHIDGHFGRVTILQKNHTSFQSTKTSPVLPTVPHRIKTP